MTKGYHHLTRDQRCQLYALKGSGESIGEIAVKLGVDRSTLYRELARNRGLKGYRFQQADEMACERKNSVAGNGRKMTDEMISVIEGKLKLQWSPEQVSGWLRKNRGNVSVSHETIYKHIWKNKRDGGSLYKEAHSTLKCDK
jgi:IS30 family transposase